MKCRQHVKKALGFLSPSAWGMVKSEFKVKSAWWNSGILPLLEMALNSDIWVGNLLELNRILQRRIPAPYWILNSEIWLGGRRTSREALKSEIWNLLRWFLWGLTWGFGICNLKSEFWICCSPLEILKVENEIWNLKSALANTDFLKFEICFLHSAFCSDLSLRSGAWKLQLEICWAECWLSEFQFLVTFAFCNLTEFRIQSLAGIKKPYH